jgi:two-component system, OmpR family, heavy metal sensor histidine kinase CusS
MSGLSMRALRTSITARLTVLFTLSVVLLLAMHGAYHYRSLAMQLEGRQAATLAEKLTAVRARLMHHEAADLLAGPAPDVMEVLTGHTDLFLAVRDDRGKILAESHPSGERPAPPGITGDNAADRTWREGASNYRTMVVATALGASHAPATVELTVDTTRDTQILRAFVREVSLGMLVGVLVACAMAFLIARQGLGALNRFASLANDITVSRLNQRLDLNLAPLELRALAAAYNGMLARLETSFSRLVDFSADLAHELRTPIHNLLGQTQVALSRLRSPDEYRQVLESNVEEYERLSRMIRDMLFLAQADNAELRLVRQPVELADLARKVASLFEAAAEERSLQIAVQGAGVAAVDRIMIERALGNLLSNALCHARPHSTIQITIAPSVNDVSIVIANQGTYIRPDVASRLFDRFYRGDSARQGEGAGLGLAIVKSIIELHGGSVSVASEPAGETRFTLRIPAMAIEGEDCPDDDPSRRNRDLPLMPGVTSPERNSFLG